mmetsp:Transcript_38222/g.87036  ORF Transcript_38222/g.87036 Transcript_38222/m.87036 type:complete len:146 (-) Transcript_38222:118-555(-)
MDAFMGDTKKIGIGLTGMGLLFTFLGVMLFFDSGLLAVGNLLFLAGLFLILGFARTKNLFLQPSKLRGTSLFFVGIFLVIIRWPKIGFMVEAFGFVNLFGNFIPHLVVVARHTPFLKGALDLPGIKQALDWMQKSSSVKQANTAV